VISQVYYCNANKFQDIANDYSDTKARVEKITKQPKDETSISVFKGALEAIPTFRRTASVQDKLGNSDYLTTAGILGYTLVNIKEDIRDTVSAGKQIRSKLDSNYHYDPLYDRKNYQHDFSATRGMIGEKSLYNKVAEGNPFAKKILELGNQTIDDTKFGHFVNKVFKISEADRHKVDNIKNYNGRCARAFKFESSILGGKTIARAMKRTTLLGVAVMGTLEVPKIISETKKGDSLLEHTENGAKQIIKSAGNVALTTAGIALGGTIGAQHLGATGSIVGMGLGAIMGSKMSNCLQTSFS
jgi:hypothetical protein